MKKFNVSVTETLCRKVEIMAETPDDALEIVEEMYCDEEIILDHGDYVGVDYEIERYS